MNVAFDTNVLIYTWRAVLPVRAAAEEDLADAVKNHRLAFWDAMLWATARRVGIDHVITEDLQDGGWCARKDMVARMRPRGRTAPGAADIRERSRMSPLGQGATLLRATREAL